MFKKIKLLQIKLVKYVAATFRLRSFIQISTCLYVTYKRRLKPVATMNYYEPCVIWVQLIILNRIIKGLIIELTFIRKSPLAPLFQRGGLFLPLTKGG